MFPLGHLGIGQQLIPARLRSRLSLRWLALGCLLPDLIDKPLWLAQSAGLFARHLSFLRGTRMVGHTLLLVVALALAARLFRSRGLGAVALGALTHAAIDLAGDLAAAPRTGWPIWLLWPCFGFRFEPAGSGTVLHHLLNEDAIYLAGEVLGGALLLAEYVRRRRAHSARLPLPIIILICISISISRRQLRHVVEDKPGQSHAALREPLERQRHLAHRMLPRA
jgi:hypothetical protein